MEVGKQTITGAGSIEDEERIDTGTTRPDPLHLPHVVQKIAKSLPFEDIKKCRVLSTDWTYNLNRIFRCRSNVNLDTLQSLEEFNKSFPNGNQPFMNFRLGPGIPMKSEACSQFFSVFGSSIRSIHFCYCDWRETEGMFKKLLEQKMPHLRELQLDLSTSFPVAEFLQSSNYLTINLPNLRSLIFDIPVRRNTEWFIAEVRQFFYHLLQRTPYLNTILYSGCKIECLPDEFIECYSCQIMFDLIVDSEEIKLPFLKRLDVIRRYSCDQLKRLETKHFPLQSLNLLVKDTLTISSMCSLITSLKNTLKNLNIMFLNQNGCLDFDVQPMQELRKLQDCYTKC